MPARCAGLDGRHGVRGQEYRHLQHDRVEEVGPLATERREEGRRQNDGKGRQPGRESRNAWSHEGEAGGERTDHKHVSCIHERSAERLQGVPGTKSWIALVQAT